MRPSLKSTTTSKSGLVLHFSVGAVAAFVRRGDINARVSHQTTTMEGMIAHQALQKAVDQTIKRKSQSRRYVIKMVIN